MKRCSLIWEKTLSLGDSIWKQARWMKRGMQFINTKEPRNGVWLAGNTARMEQRLNK